jgi:hypothetical protein
VGGQRRDLLRTVTALGGSRVVENLAAFLPAVLWDLDDPETRWEL